MSYGSRYTLDDVVQSMKKTGVGLKGKTFKSLHFLNLQVFSHVLEQHVKLIVMKGSDS